jgi:hypothetical protein
MVVVGLLQYRCEVAAGHCDFVWPRVVRHHLVLAEEEDHRLVRCREVLVCLLIEISSRALNSRWTIGLRISNGFVPGLNRVSNVIGRACRGRS